MRDLGTHEVAPRTCKTGGLGQGWLADGLSIVGAGAESLGPPSLPPVELGLARMHYVPTVMLQARRSRKGPLPLVAVCLPGRTWDTNIASLMQVRELKAAPNVCGIWMSGVITCQTEGPTAEGEPSCGREQSLFQKRTSAAVLGAAQSQTFGGRANDLARLPRT